MVSLIKTPTQRVQLILVHPKPPVKKYWAKHHRSFFKELSQFTQGTEISQIIVGDMNTSPWGIAFQKFEKETGLINTQKGFGVQPSWPILWPLLFIPIDHILVSPRIQVLKRETGPNVGSDHRPVFVELRFQKENRLK